MLTDTALSSADIHTMASAAAAAADRDSPKRMDDSLKHKAPRGVVHERSSGID